MNYVTNTEELTSIADAIREKGGTSAPLEYPEEYVSAIEAISGGGGGGGITADDVAMRTISGVVSGSATFIGSYAFQFCRSLITASFPVCTSIGNSTFQNCYSLTAASFPACTRIGNYAFQSCSSLTTASFPACVSIGSNAFQNCYSLTAASFPACMSIGNYAFQSCRSLITASFPVCTSIGNSTFQDCTSLTTALFPACMSIGVNAFQSCINLISFYLMGSSIPRLLNSNAFTNTPIGGYSATAGQYGNIFVPASLYDSYLTASNWSYFASRFVSV